jgi:hypothetical protein
LPQKITKQLTVPEDIFMNILKPIPQLQRRDLGAHVYLSSRRVMQNGKYAYATTGLEKRELKLPAEQVVSILQSRIDMAVESIKDKVNGVEDSNGG